MASAGKLSHLQPVRITELMGHPKSAGKEPASERKKIEPIRIKQLLESASKSCSRTNDRTTRGTFLIPGQGVRRKLYDRSPSPRAPRPSICPKSSSRPSARASNFSHKNPPNPTTLSRFSLFPSRTTQPPKTLTKTLTTTLTKLPTKPPTKPMRKSFLLPPNSIVKLHIEKATHEKSMLSSSLISEEDNPKESLDEEQEQLLRPTVIMSAQSSKKNSNSKNLENEEPILDALNSTFSKDPESSNDQNDLEKSLENKENIPPSVETPMKPLAESKTMKFDPVNFELHQETHKRLEKIEIKREEDSKTINRILEVMTEMYDLLKIKNEEKREISSVPVENELLDKENVNLTSQARRRSKVSPLERRRSARLAKQNNIADDSFSLLEKKLNVKTSGKVTKVVTPGKKTPVHDQFMRRRSKSERALREYLAMKASMSYLETPEAGKFRNIQGEHTPSGKKSLRRSISRKVFDELQDLYSDDVEDNV